MKADLEKFMNGLILFSLLIKKKFNIYNILLFIKKSQTTIGLKKRIIKILTWNNK